MKNQNKYNLSMHFQTDGDYGWGVVPSGFNYDGDFNYHMDRTFYSKEEMQSWGRKFVPFLIENFHSGKPYVRDHIQNALIALMEAMNYEEDYYDSYSGNYEGTYIDFKCEGNEVELTISVPTETFNEIREEEVTYNDLMEGIRYAIERRKRLDKRRINDQLRAYVEKNIIPRYESNKNGHDVSHIDYVTNRSIMFAQDLDVDMDMVYAIAVYHDLGHEKDPEHHEIISAKMFLQDKEMEEFFTQEQRDIIADAIVDHRASNGKEPRTVYGKIVSSADRSTDVAEIMQRTYQYCKNKHPDFNDEQICQYAMKHIKDKFGPNGYALKKIYFQDQDFSEFLIKIRKLLINTEEFNKEFKKNCK